MDKDLKEMNQGIRDTISIIKKMESHPNPHKQQIKILAEGKQQLKQLMHVRDNYIILCGYSSKN